MYGIDISGYQKGIDFSKKEIKFVIMKATDGPSYVDSQFFRFTKMAVEQNKLIGCYHFAEPTEAPSLPRMYNEAMHFLDTVDQANLIGKAILVLDWECKPFDRPDLINKWCETIEQQTRVVPFIYGSKSKLLTWKQYTEIFSRPLWMAAWPSNATQYAGDTMKVTMASKEQIPWKIWQYSSNGKLNGITVDLDYTTMTEGEWLKAASKKEEAINEDMKWAIENNIYIGYPDGSYRPNSPLTRQELATVLRRYTQLFMNYS